MKKEKFIVWVQIERVTLDAYGEDVDYENESEEHNIAEFDTLEAAQEFVDGLV